MSYWTQFPRDRINRRQLLTLGALGASAGFLAACGGKNAGPSNQATAVASPIVTRSNPRLEVPDPKIQVRQESIAPRDTDPAIDIQFAEPHIVFFPVAPVRGLMFLFLHATGQVPDDYLLISQQAARNGYHAINLRYASMGFDFATLCGPSPEPDCSENAKIEQFTGADRSDKLNVNRANSTENRLTKLLACLQARFPGDGWGAYAARETAKWQSIAIAGHSQGSVQAPFIARDYSVARVIMFSGPAAYLGPPGHHGVAFP